MLIISAYCLYHSRESQAIIEKLKMTKIIKNVQFIPINKKKLG